MSVFKNRSRLTSVNPAYRDGTQPLRVRPETDGMRGRVRSRDIPCRLRHATDHDAGAAAACVPGTREEDILRSLWERLSGLNTVFIEVCSDNHFADHKVIPQTIPVTEKKNTQKIERKHLTVRTRLKRPSHRTVCCSKSIEMHGIPAGLLMNHPEFGCKLF